jgi:hypothetical protein
LRIQVFKKKKLRNSRDKRSLEKRKEEFMKREVEVEVIVKKSREEGEIQERKVINKSLESIKRDLIRRERDRIPVVKKMTRKNTHRKSRSLKREKIKERKRTKRKIKIDQCLLIDHHLSLVLKLIDLISIQTKMKLINI